MRPQRSNEMRSSLKLLGYFIYMRAELLRVQQLLETGHRRVGAREDAAAAPRGYALGGAGHRELAEQQRVAVAELLGRSGDLLVVTGIVATLQSGQRSRHGLRRY